MAKLPVFDVKETDQLPAAVYVPVPSFEPDTVELVIELRELPDGRDVLQVFSSLELLAEACGTDQSWVQVAAVDLPEVATYADFDSVLLDATMPRTVDGLPATEEIVREEDADWLYVPCVDQARDSEELELELHEIDGEPALLVYTSKPLLLACCGRGQPWTAIGSDQLERLCDAVGVDMDQVGVNLPLPDRFRRDDDGRL